MTSSGHPGAWRLRAPREAVRRAPIAASAAMGERA